MGYVFRAATEQLQDNKENVLEAVETKGYTSKNSSDEYKNPEFLLRVIEEIDIKNLSIKRDVKI